MTEVNLVSPKERQKIYLKKQSCLLELKAIMQPNQRSGWKQNVKAVRLLWISLQFLCVSLFLALLTFSLCGVVLSTPVYDGEKL